MGTLHKFLVVFGICCGIWSIVRENQTSHEQRGELIDWLKQWQLDKYIRVLQDMEMTSPVEFADMDYLPQHAAFRKLKSHVQLQLSQASQQLKEYLILQQWLQEEGLDHYLQPLYSDGVGSLDKVSVHVLDRLAQQGSDGDYTKLQNVIKSMTQQQLSGQKRRLWERVSVRRSHITWNVGGMVVFATTVALLYTWVSSNYEYLTEHPPPTRGRTRLYEYITGSFLDPARCYVEWGWKEPQAVGETLKFTIQFYQRNGMAYPISDHENVVVEILQGSTQVSAYVEVGSAESSKAHTAHVTFTVRRAGTYRVVITLGAGIHIAGSPFHKDFIAGPVVAEKTGFVHHSSTVVLTEGEFFPLVVQPRDQYENVCSQTIELNHGSGYNLQITPVGNRDSSTDPIKQKLSVLSDDQTKQIVMYLKLDTLGSYKAVGTYRGSSLKNGDFNILVLSKTDSSMVQKNVAKKSVNVWFEAYLLLEGKKTKKVYCYISPKQLTVREFILRIIPRRLYTFRVCPSTKFTFSGLRNSHELPSFTVDDGCQPPVHLACKDRNVLAATFSQFLLKNIGGSETFSDKQDFFYREVRKSHSKKATWSTNISVKVNRRDLLDSSMKSTKHFSSSDWGKTFVVSFYGEEGLDWGGLSREWFQLVTETLFRPDTQLFRRFKDDNQGLVHPNPDRPLPVTKPKYYEFAGKVVGKCLFESAKGGSSRQLVKARFSRSFLAQLIGLRVTYKHFAADDPEFYKTKVHYIETNDVEDMELTFTEEVYDVSGKLVKTVELVPGGAHMQVTNANKLQYLDSLAQYRLAATVQEELEHFLKGLNELIPDNLLSIFDENELELLICGTGDYSIADFKQHCEIQGGAWGFEKVLDWFWTIVASFTQEEVARLLQFTTGSSQLPPGGFAELNPRFQICSVPVRGILPTAHTCFNQLCLPDYDSCEQLHKMLTLAITEGSQGFGMA
ncbi:apoptosis-resistant E3 ubiquitin protein ligase 1-like isoform X1 [Branchiostoma floridae]|uniref:HECT-type E3 ubiquitin transferase n=1 Tax=Branchiostoma floridae TaxID=7739 RepID=A0A9J7LMT6_BRAFL|nr:apoptosis-resistant E3 ubiquitin protein ligase 1-like isoform X1 [Branchiostoma floridae]XP_035684610.1 apoptosis-resistant E3 ubiquitin protein ligase 1-like isoform X1 [Branchiostoma floridae]